METHCSAMPEASLGREHIELELVRTLDAPGVVHQRYRVVGSPATTRSS
jgi:hypothetical protein